MWNPEARDSSPIIFFHMYEFVLSGSCARSGGVKEWENPLIRVNLIKKRLFILWFWFKLTIDDSLRRKSI